MSIAFRRDIGIDLGTANTLVYVKGKGVVLTEPSVVAVDIDTKRPVAFGKQAQMMVGRASSSSKISVVRPLKDGVISEYETTMSMLQHYIKRACGITVCAPRVVICVPSGITEVEERAVLDAAAQAGARTAVIISEPLAAARGAGLDISKPNGHMVVDIGGGTTDIAILSLGDIVISDSIKVAGHSFDEAIIQYVSEKHGVLIGERTAEYVKIRIGAVYRHKSIKTVKVRGRNITTGMPVELELGSHEMLGAIIEPISSIIDAICGVIERATPELASDILRNGIYLTGGGALIYGFDKLVEEMTGVKTRVAENAASCVALGTGKKLDEITGGSSDEKKKNPFRPLIELIASLFRRNNDQENTEDS